LIRHPDGSSGITKPGSAAFEVFDADPGADQGINPALNEASVLQIAVKPLNDHQSLFLFEPSGLLLSF